MIRRADGGSNALTNLVVACRKCNNGRHSVSNIRSEIGKFETWDFQIGSVLPADEIVYAQMAQAYIIAAKLCHDRLKNAVDQSNFIQAAMIHIKHKLMTQFAAALISALRRKRN